MRPTKSEKSEKSTVVGLCNEPDNCTFFSNDYRAHYHKPNGEIEILEQTCSDGACVYTRFLNRPHYHTSGGKVIDADSELLAEMREKYDKKVRDMMNAERIKLLGLEYLDSMVFIDGTGFTAEEKIAKWNAYISELNKISNRIKDGGKKEVLFDPNIKIVNNGDSRYYRVSPNLTVNTAIFSTNVIVAHDPATDVTETIRLPIMFMTIDNKWLEGQALIKARDLLGLDNEPKRETQETT